MRGYNAMGGYNTHQYNADGSELNFSETTSLVDSFPVSYSSVFDEFIFLSELFGVQVTSKVLSDRIRISDWLSIERNPINNEWYD